MTSLPQTTPIRHVVLKVHSRCNLSCAYCYVYTHVDQTWRDRPQTMARPVIDRTAQRIAEHARAWRLPRVEVTLHGGEPLLAGLDTLRYAISSLKAAVAPATTVDVTVQTNGILLTDAMLQLFREQNVRVGVSLDGDSRANDRHRITARGGGSYAAVAAGLRRLNEPRYRDLFSGLLCTVDVENDPVAVYEGLLAFGPPRVDFLLPHGNWTTAPPGRHPGTTDTPYADWLSRIFDRWYDAPRYETDVRLFSSIMSLLMGGHSGTEAVGLDPVAFLVVETDGAIEQGDALKTTASGMAATGLHVERHSFDEALAQPGMRARQIGIDALCATCRSCALVRVCGGGLYAHRYDARNGFGNPTVYCPDQMKLISHIGQRLERDIQALRTRSGTVARGPAAYSLDQESLRAFGRGDSSDRLLRTLVSAQASKRRVLLRAVHDSAGRLEGNADGGLAEAWQTLLTVTRDAPDAAREVLTHPFTDAWAVRWLRSPNKLGESLPEQLSYLAGIAAAAAVRGGLAARLHARTGDGQLHVPTIGTASGLGDGVTTIETTPTALTITGPDRTVTVAAPYDQEQPGWAPTRRLVAGDVTLAVEDLDPFRSVLGHGVSARLTAADHQRLQRLFVDAWDLIDRHHPTYAARVRTCVRSLVPLAPPRSGSVSASSRDAFGCVASSIPHDAHQLALLLIHETQHLVLNGILDIVDLVHDTASTLYMAPWRADPRPAAALLHGVFAHSGVADYWRVQRGLREGSPSGLASFEFAYWLEQTLRAADEILNGDELTSLGVTLVEAVRATLRQWRQEPIAPELSNGVKDLVDAVTVRWRLANYRPDLRDVDTVARALRKGSAAAAVGGPIVLAGAPGPAPSDGLVATIVHALGAGQGRTTTPAEAAYQAGDFASAVDAYLRQVTMHADDHDAWAGLAVALGRSRHRAAAAALIARPDLVRTAYRMLGSEVTLTPSLIGALSLGAPTYPGTPTTRVRISSGEDRCRS